MGEDLIRKRNDQFRRLGDKNLEAVATCDLFASCKPVIDREMAGFPYPGELAQYDEILVVSEKQGRISCFRGVSPVVLIDGEPADSVRLLLQKSSADLFARVVSVSSMVMIKIISWNRTKDA